MSSSSLAGDRRPVPMVAIVGNDVVLAAAPATPVQLAHACLRRGFSVAVPASWGDELLASEAMSRLASRDRGPAVMCVCPYVRARLLAPGPDLAPFLVSLVSPPVATARYLRMLYGDHAVHITYIGGCPSGEDAAIDARLTPDDFLADLADQGIALSEQPLVFDSIVPPDRRRWYSLPGGVPSPEGLSSETDARSLVEIDRDDASTDLVQHIITRDHVLLDLAPSLGCACSGAVGAVPARNARLAVMALEPPRALGPIIDSSAVVALDVPVGVAALGRVAPVVDPPAAADPRLESVLDEILGAGADDVTDAPARESDEATVATIDEPFVVEPVVAEAEATLIEPVDRGLQRHTGVSEVGDIAQTAGDTAAVEAPAQDPMGTEVASSAEGSVEAQEPARTKASVPRRTPPTVHARYSSATIPKATGADGRPLPRAYGAKRKTPPTGAVVIPTINLPALDQTVRPQPGDATAPSDPASIVAAAPAASERPGLSPPEASAPNEASLAEGAEAVVVPAAISSVVQAPEPDRRPSAASAAATQGASAAAASAANNPTTEHPTPAGSEARAGSAAAPAANQGALVFLLVTALVALAAFVLISLRR